MRKLVEKNNIIQTIFDYADSKLEHREFVPGKTQIPASFPKLSAMDVAVMGEVLLSLWYTEHKQCTKFSMAMIGLLAKRHAVLTNSGSSASLVATTACVEHFGKKRSKSNLVITCATGFPTTVAPIYQNGLVPYYIDIDPLTLSPDLEHLEDVIKRYKDEIAGVSLAHTLGFPYDESKVRDIIGDDIWFLADCCDAFGAEVSRDGDFPHVSWVGEWADVQTHSFFPAHIITTVEGGAVLTDSEALDGIMRSLVNWGRDCYCLPGQSNTCGHRFDQEDKGELPDGWDHKYIFARLGYNLKMTEFQAALGYSQLLRIRDFKEARQNNFQKLKRGLAQYERFFILTEVPEWSKPVPFGFPILMRRSCPFSLKELVDYLEEHKISTRRVFGGNLTRQPGFMNLPYKRTDLSGCDIVMNQMFWIGCHPMITDEMIAYILETFEEFMKQWEQ